MCALNDDIWFVFKVSVNIKNYIHAVSFISARTGLYEMSTEQHWKRNIRKL